MYLVYKEGDILHSPVTDKTLREKVLDDLLKVIQLVSDKAESLSIVFPI